MRQTRKRRTASQWKELVADWRSSGKSRWQYAQEHELKPSTLGYWAKRLRAESEDTHRGTRSERSGAAFVPVRVVSEAESGAKSLVEVTTPNGTVIRLRGAAEASTVAAVLEAVGRW